MSPLSKDDTGARILNETAPISLLDLVGGTMAAALLLLLVRMKKTVRFHPCRQQEWRKIFHIPASITLSKFHETGSTSYALQRLDNHAVGCLCPVPDSYSKGFCVRESDLMIKRFFNALVLPAVAYGFEVWGPCCSRALPPDVPKMACIQKPSSSVIPPSNFREVAERQWMHNWWQNHGQVTGSMPVQHA